MTLRSPGFSPVRAILWENWRLTRVEVAWRLALGIVGGTAVLVVSGVIATTFFEGRTAVTDLGATIALFIILFPNLLGWLSRAQLNGGQPGFPFVLLYTRPVRTAALVGVPMAYSAVAASAIYLISVMFLRATFGYRFPLLPAATWIAALNVIYAAAYWSTRKRVVQMLSVMAAAGFWVGRIARHFNGDGIDWGNAATLWPTLFSAPMADYALFGVIGLASFGLTVAAVERQRHGGGRASISWSGVGLPDSLISLFRFPCPTSSAMRAQVWFELRSRGLPLLAIGVALAIVNLILFAIGGPIDALINARESVDCPRGECFYARPMAMFFAVMSVPAVLTLSGNAFGILAKQGRVYASPFDATQPFGTGRLAILKILVRSACALAALTAVAVSVWAPGTLSAAGEIFGDPLRGVQRALEGAVGALTSSELFALAAAGAIGVVLMVASRAAFVALRMCYPRQLNIAGSLVLLYGGVLVLLTLAGQRWNVPLGAILRGTSWVAASAILCATVYLARRTFAERLLTWSEAWGIVVLSAMFAAAWLTLLRAAGVSLAGMPVADAVRMLSPTLLPLTIGVLAPWSYSRVRHT
jgi:hypothetical protein